MSNRYHVYFTRKPKRGYEVRDDLTGRREMFCEDFAAAVQHQIHLNKPRPTLTAVPTQSNQGE